MLGLIGKKIGMTQIFDPDGKVIPVTVIQAGPCRVVYKRSKAKEGYDALQLGYEEIEEKEVIALKLDIVRKMVVLFTVISGNSVPQRVKILKI